MKGWSGLAFVAFPAERGGLAAVRPSFPPDPQRPHSGKAFHGPRSFHCFGAAALGLPRPLTWRDRRVPSGSSHRTTTRRCSSLRASRLARRVLGSTRSVRSPSVVNPAWRGVLHCVRPRQAAACGRVPTQSGRSRPNVGQEPLRVLTATRRLAFLLRLCESIFLRHPTG